MVKTQSSEVSYSVSTDLHPCVCVTIASSERLFSATGNIVTPLRAHLSPDKVEMLTSLSKNLKRLFDF